MNRKQRRKIAALNRKGAELIIQVDSSVPDSEFLAVVAWAATQGLIAERAK